MQLAEASQRLSAGEFTLQFQIQCGFPGKPVQLLKFAARPRICPNSDGDMDTTRIKLLQVHFGQVALKGCKQCKAGLITAGLLSKIGL